MTDAQLIKLLIDLKELPKECEWVEFKVNNENPFDIGEYISALSNTACYSNLPNGYLVFGINNEHELVGTDFSPSTAKKGNQELENWLATLLSPRIDFNIYEFNHEGKKFVIFKIDATHNTPVAFRGESYIRIGSYKKKLDDHPERERKIWNIQNRKVFEKGLAIMNIGGNDVLELIDYRNYFKMQGLPPPSSKKEVIDRFIQEKMIIPEEKQYSITNLCALLFANSLNNFENLSRKVLRVIIYNGDNRLKTIREHASGKGYAIGFERTIEFILNILPSTEEIKTALRKTVYTYPPLAIRELVANALIHQDLHVSGASSMVEIFRNRIEITNPGKPLIDPLRFVDHSPESRNEMLARFMRRLKVCEERGSGIDRVIYECELNQLPAPEFIVGDNFTRVILYGPRTLRQMDKRDKIRACYQHACLKYVSGELMTNQTLRERLAVEEKNYSIVSRIIADTKEEGLIKDFDPKNKAKTHAKYSPFWA
jgi:ATP-dependent DNA helicase RecG